MMARSADGLISVDEIEVAVEEESTQQSTTTWKQEYRLLVQFTLAPPFCSWTTSYPLPTRTPRNISTTDARGASCSLPNGRPGAQYIVPLDNGRGDFQGVNDAFQASRIVKKLIQSHAADPADEKDENQSAPGGRNACGGRSRSRVHLAWPELRVGGDDRTVHHHCGGGYQGHWPFWMLFSTVIVISCRGPVAENAWLKVCTDATIENGGNVNPVFYIFIYGGVYNVLLLYERTQR